MFIVAPLWLASFIAAGITGVLRGYPVAGWVLGFLFGPFGLLAMALSEKKLEKLNDREIEAGNKIARAKAFQEQSALKSRLVKCRCGEMVPAKENCPFCGASPS